MKKLITFLGVNSYEKVSYLLEDRKSEKDAFRLCTPFVQRALCEKEKPDIMYVLTTEEAKQKNYAPLERETAESVRDIQNVMIPLGRTEEELWQIFSAMTGCLERKDQVIFDITHSLRSLPLLAFIAASFLRVEKDVRLKGIYYGAYDVRSPSRCSDGCTYEAPIFDLSRFLSLVRLTTATHNFLQSGDASDLAENLPEQLKKGVTDISDGLRQLRPIRVMRSARRLPELLKAEAPEVVQNTPALLPLLQRVQREFGGLALPDDETGDPYTLLRRLLDMAEWYASRRQFVHALAIAREWLPTYMCRHLGYNYQDLTSRQMMESILNNEKMPPKASAAEWNQAKNCWTDSVQIGEMRDLWRRVTATRNEVLHCGFAQSRTQSISIPEETQRLIQSLRAFSNEWLQRER